MIEDDVFDQVLDLYVLAQRAYCDLNHHPLTIAGHGHGEVNIEFQLGVQVAIGRKSELIAWVVVVCEFGVKQQNHQDKRYDGH